METITESVEKEGGFRSDISNQMEDNDGDDDDLDHDFDKPF